MAKLTAYKSHEIGRFKREPSGKFPERHVSLRSDGAMLGRHRNEQGTLTEWRIIGKWSPITGAEIKSLRASGWIDIPKKHWEVEL